MSIIVKQRSYDGRLAGKEASHTPYLGSIDFVMRDHLATCRLDERGPDGDARNRSSICRQRGKLMYRCMGSERPIPRKCAR